MYMYAHVCKHAHVMYCGWVLLLMSYLLLPVLAIVKFDEGFKMISSLF